MSLDQNDRGPEFDGVRIGRPAAGALIDAGYRTFGDLPEDLDGLLGLHGVGPSAVRRLREAFVRVGGGHLAVEGFGDRGDPAVLLVGGACQSMDWWEPELCRRLAAGGRFVIRFDARDTGRSSTSPVGAPAYSGDDLATDPLVVLDALGFGRAHVVGLSMGGGIGQRLAASYAERVASLTLIATSAAGERADDSRLPEMSQELAAAMENPPAMPDADDTAGWVDYLVDDQRAYSGAAVFDEVAMRRVAEVVVRRSRDLAASMTNHWVAIERKGSLPPFAMASITAPVLVLHGTADPVFPLGHGEALAAEIPDATLMALEGMGHEIPPPSLWDAVVPAIVDHTRAAT